MGDTLHIQVRLNAGAGQIFPTLSESEALAAWFAEHAQVEIPERRYDFWGRFTPETPDREAGRHELQSHSPGEHLSFGWRLRGSDTTVEFALVPEGDTTIVVVRHSGLGGTPYDGSQCSNEDFWFLSLENLRRYVEGRRDVVRCDFSRSMTGDITHTVEIDGWPSEVFETLVKPEQLERWIASKATVEPYVGGNFDLGWGAGGPVKILEFVPNERFATSWPEETPTVVTWTLEGSGGKTRLTLVHSGFAPDKPTGGYNAGWLNFMSWVKSVVEYGPGWQPPVLPLGEDMRPFYAASIGNRQDELVLPVR